MKGRKQPRRVFSTELKRKIVKDLEQGKASIAEVSREYSVSKVSIYRWLNEYSSLLKSGAKLVVELNSEGYRSKQLEKQVKDLEAALGRKQLEIDFLNKLIELAGDELGVDIKKKLSTRPLTGSDFTQKKGKSR